MALRVLLADESVTIKKVIQLALQDFAVEVKAVPVGLDVLEVSKSFQPDLVFADILLQKRSGYEVCADLKKDPATAAIPVVLMWSSFMELDQRQVDTCGADGRLEKPFEVEALRKLVLELVPRTRSQRLAHFLEYPPTLAAPLRTETSQQAARYQESKAASAPSVAPTVSAGPGGATMSSVSTTPSPAPAKPKMPPPLASSPAPSSPTPRAPAANPFGSSFGAPPKIEKPAEAPAAPVKPPKPVAPLSDPFAGTATGLTGLTGLTPGIPDRAAPKAANPPPLGALPDLQLEGQSRPASSTWNMESFEPLDVGGLTLDDDDDDVKESFQPIQLPQAEPTPAPNFSSSKTNATDAAFNLTGDDDDAEADQWSNRSLDKYRLPPLKPDESLAVDDMTPDFAAGHAPARRTTRHEDSPPRTDSITERLPSPPPPIKRDRAAAEPLPDVPQFTLSSNDVDETSVLEIEHVEQHEKSRPAIVRELMRDPDFTQGAKQSNQDGAIDLSASGRSSAPAMTSNAQLEAMVRDQVAPQLEKVIEKIVAQLLPQIAERIIKRELERLLEES